MKTLRIDYTDARLIDTAIRLSIGQAVSDEDRQFYAGHAGALSRLWSKASAIRNTLAEAARS